MKNMKNKKNLKPKIKETIDGYNRVFFSFGMFSINMESNEDSMEGLISQGKKTMEWFLDTKLEKAVKTVNKSAPQCSCTEEEDESETPHAMFG